MILTEDEEVTVDPRQASRIKELDQYAQGVSVYYQEKAWVDPIVARAHLEDFNRQTKPELENNSHFRILGLDNLLSQKIPPYRDFAVGNGIKLVYTPENCTDLCSVVDDEIGDFVKSEMNRCYRLDREISVERNDAWCSGKISASERRILMTKWLKVAWDKLCATDITAFL